MKHFYINPVNSDENFIKEVNRKIDNKTKPIGALGKLEKLAQKICLIQNTLSPELINPYILVFAGDHGIVESGVSAYPQDVTYQMVFNFLNGGAGINVFADQNDIKLKIIDAGVNYDFPENTKLIDRKIDKGTKNFLNEPAMTLQQMNEAIQKGSDLVNDLKKEDCNVIGFGEMGIGNTSSASVIMSLLCNLPIEECVGYGAGLDDKGLENKKNILKSAIDKHDIHSKSPTKILQTYGGFEIAMMIGAMLQAAEDEMILLIDGFIVTSAYLIAAAIEPAIREYCIFSHRSDENGHNKMLSYLNADPILDLCLRLGEGTGAAVAYPIIKYAVNFLNKMASFESAGVSNKSE